MACMCAECKYYEDNALPFEGVGMCCNIDSPNVTKIVDTYAEWCEYGEIEEEGTECHQLTI